MNQPSYDVLTSEDRLHYEFISTGSKGSIRKVVEYTYMSQLNMWNLGFGDFDTTTEVVSDSVISNNGDGKKVMATVVKTLLDFFSQRPREIVIFTGSDERRTIVYKRIIHQHYVDFSDRLLIRGLTVEGIEEAIETSVDYIAFIVRSK